MCVCVCIYYNIYDNLYIRRKNTFSIMEINFLYNLIKLNKKGSNMKNN